MPPKIEDLRIQWTKVVLPPEQNRLSVPIEAGEKRYAP